MKMKKLVTSLLAFSSLAVAPVSIVQNGIVFADRQVDYWNGILVRFDKGEIQEKFVPGYIRDITESLDGFNKECLNYLRSRERL